MNKKTTLNIAIIVFVVIAILHLLRYILGWELTINNCTIPQWASILGAIAPTLLAYYLYKLKD